MKDFLYMDSITGLQLRSLVGRDGDLRLSLEPTTFGPLLPDEVLIRMEAAPINPSDIGLLLAQADGAKMRSSSDDGRPVAHGRIPAWAMDGLSARFDQSVAVGNEGAGTVIATGDDAAAQALFGRTVAVAGGATFAEYRVAVASDVLVLPPGMDADAGAAAFVNPLTALAMLETMRLEGHTALIHTAAASNLGQMLNRLCIVDGVPLVSVVRSAGQKELLTVSGATYVIDSSNDDFDAQLAEAVAATGATLAFDAIGGGGLAGKLLAAMENAIGGGQAYSRYGSAIHKQVYIYGSLDHNPTEVLRNFGMAWGIGGWLLTSVLPRIGAARADQLRQRVAAELLTTFRSQYAASVSLAGALHPKVIAAYAARQTGEKYLIHPGSNLRD